jgi:hypothetical protein
MGEQELKQAQQLRFSYSVAWITKERKEQSANEPQRHV